MAVPAGTFQTHKAVGNREDLSDSIWDISPTDVAFSSNCSRDTAKAVQVEWQIDELAAAVSNNAHIEGDDATTNTAAPTQRLSNVVQLLDKVPRVSSTQQSVNSAGRRNELNHQVMKANKEIKRDLESSVTGTQAGTAGATNAARTMAGFACWAFDNQVKLGANATTPAVTSGYPSTAPTAGTDVALTEAHLKSAIGLAWDNGGDPSVVMVGRSDKQSISAFTGIATQYRDNQKDGPAVIIGAADMYVSDFGTHYIVANRFMPSDNVYVLDFEYLTLSFLQPFGMEPLAKTGHSDRVMISGEVTLKVKSPKANAKIYTTAG